MRNTTARAPAVKYIYLSSGLLHYLPQYAPQMVQGCRMSSVGNNSDQAVSAAGVKFHRCFPYRALKRNYISCANDLSQFNSRHISHKPQLLTALTFVFYSLGWFPQNCITYSLMKALKSRTRRRRRRCVHFRACALLAYTC